VVYSWPSGNAEQDEVSLTGIVDESGSLPNQTAASLTNGLDFAAKAAFAPDQVTTTSGSRLAPFSSCTLADAAKSAGAYLQKYAFHREIEDLLAARMRADTMEGAELPLERVLRRSLAIEREHRYGSVTEMRAELAEALQGCPAFPAAVSASAAASEDTQPIGTMTSTHALEN
jgi:hypothetical protein